MKNVAAAAALAAMTIAAAVLPAAAAQACEEGGGGWIFAGVEVAPDPFVVDSYDGSTGVIKVQLVESAPKLSSLVASIRRVGEDEEYQRTDEFTPVKGAEGIYHAKFGLTLREKAGTWRVDLIAEDAAGVGYVADSAATFRVKRHTFFSRWDASPEPVVRDGQLTVRGRLVRMRTTVPGTVPLAGRAVGIYFRAAGTSDRVLVTKVETDSAGRFRASVRATGDGAWYAKFPGSRYLERQSSRGDFVDVQ